MKNFIQQKSKRITLTLSAVLSVLLLGSCDRGDDDDTSTGNNYKVTVTIPNVEATHNNALDDYVSFIVGGATENVGESTIWKLNGEEMTGQNVVGLDEDDFEGATKTYVFESTKKLLTMSTKVQIINNNAPISIYYKIEKNGNTEVEQNVTLQDDEDHTKQYTF